MLDIAFMKAVHHKVNIVPVIAKADTLTKAECQRLKKRVRPTVTPPSRLKETEGGFIWICWLNLWLNLLWVVIISFLYHSCLLAKYPSHGVTTLSQHSQRDIHLWRLCLGTWCFHGFLKSNFRNCDPILAVVVMFGDALPFYYILWDNLITLKGYSIVHGNGTSGGELNRGVINEPLKVWCLRFGAWGVLSSRVAR